MKVVDFSIFGMGIGLVIIGITMRKQGKRNWLALLAGGITMLILGVLSAVFGLSL